MGIGEPKFGTAPRLYVAFRGSGRTDFYHRRGSPVIFRTSLRLQTQSPARWFTSLTTPGSTAQPSVPSVKVIVGGTPPHRFLQEFPVLIKPTGIHKDVQYNTTHHIRTTSGPPVACHPRRLAPDVLAVAKAELDAMLRDGTAEGPWSSPYT